MVNNRYTKYYTIVLWKSANGRSTLQVCQRWGGRSFDCFARECPCHVYSDSMPSKQITGKTVKYNRIISGFKVKSWRHTTLGTAPFHHEHGVACWLVVTFSEVLQSSSPQICIALEAALLKLLAKLAPRWVLIQVNFDPIQEIGSKVGGGCSFVSGRSFTRLWYKLYHDFVAICIVMSAQHE